MSSLLVVVAGLWAGRAAVLANPYSQNFDALIAELQARSAALANTEDKVELKQKKAVDKVLASFAKPSVSLVTDLKVAAKAAKALAKAFPAEFLPAATVAAPALLASGDLSDLLQAALDAFDGDIQALLAAAQAVVDSASPGQCQDKAQAVLDAVAAQLAAAGGAPDLPTFAKMLGTAAKTVLKGQALAEAALECSPDFGGLEWYEWVLSMTVDGELVSMSEDARGGGPDIFLVTLYKNGALTLDINKGDVSQGLSCTTFLGNPPGPGSSFLGGTYWKGTNTYSITSGSLTIAKFPKTLPNRLNATFQFAATGDAGTVTVTGGVLSVWLYPAQF